MILQDKINETVNAIALHHNFTILDSEETGVGHDDLEVELQFTDKITKEELQIILKDIKGVTYHIAICSKLVAILVGIYESHIV